MGRTLRESGVRGVEPHQFHIGDDIRHQAPPAPSISSRVTTQLVSTLLPEGYPASVTPDYFEFQVWDTAQALCSYVRGMISQEAILRGVGVGSSAATALSAVTSFFVRDLTSMAAGITFTYMQGSDLDVYAKQWRLAADCLNNIGMTLELISPVFPRAFLLLATLGAIARAITGTAGGATRTALTQHFSRGDRGSPGDISAKEGSQEAVTTLLGMLLGMLVLQASARLRWASWAAFVALTALHVLANVQALRALRLASINPYRLGILVSAAILAADARRDDVRASDAANRSSEACMNDAGAGTAATGVAPSVPLPASCTPARVGKLEPLLVPALLRCSPSHAAAAAALNVDLGVDLRSFLPGRGALLRAAVGAPTARDSAAADQHTKEQASAWQEVARQLDERGCAVLCGVPSRRSRAAIQVVAAADTNHLRSCCAAAAWAIVAARDLRLRRRGGGDAEGANFSEFVGRTKGSAAPVHGNVAVVLPELEEYEFSTPCGDKPIDWWRVDVGRWIGELQQLGWDVDKLRWKCRHTYTVDSKKDQ